MYVPIVVIYRQILIIMSSLDSAILDLNPKNQISILFFDIFKYNFQTNGFPANTYY